MPYRGEQAPAAAPVDDGTNRLLTVLGASALAYPIARLLLEALWKIPYAATEQSPAFRRWLIASYSIFALHALPALVALVLAWRAKERDHRLLYGLGGAAMLVGLGIELLPFTELDSYKWERVVATLFVSGSLASIAAGVARTRRASEDNDTGVLLSSVVALAAGGIVEIVWWVVDGYMFRSPYGWTSIYDDRGVEEVVTKIGLSFFLVPLALLGGGALVRARARRRAPVSLEPKPEHEAAEADALVVRLRGARNVLVAFALATIAAALPTLVLLAGMMARTSGPIGIRHVARVLVFLQGMLATSLAMGFVASGGDLKNDDRPMRMGLLLGLLFHLLVVVILLGGEALGLAKLDTEVACGFWSAGAAASIFAHAELARSLLHRGITLGSAADDLPEGLVPFVEELRRLVRFVAIGAAIAIGALFFGNRAGDASTITTLWVLGSFASIGAIIGVLLAASRARRVLDRAILWRLAGRR